MDDARRRVTFRGQHGSQSVYCRALPLPGRLLQLRRLLAILRNENLLVPCPNVLLRTYDGCNLWRCPGSDQGKRRSVHTVQAVRFKATLSG